MEPIPVSNKTFEQEKAEFYEIVYKMTGTKNADKADIQKAEKMIRNNPHIWEIGSGFAGSTFKGFLDKMALNKGVNLIFEAEALSIKDRLGYSSSSQIEKLIIDQILLCWIGLNYIEHKVSSMVMIQHALREGEYWQDILTCYQRRYLRAIESLARIRKLGKGFALQFNIATDGGRQINVNDMAGK